MKIEEIAKEIKEINEFCQSSYKETESFMISERITKLNSYSARSAYLFSKAQLLRDRAKGNAAENLFQQMVATGLSLSPTQSKEIIAGRTAIEESVYRLCERTNRTITHQIDALRTQLSFNKSLPT